MCLTSAALFADESDVQNATTEFVPEDVSDVLQSAFVLDHFDDEANRCFLDLMSRDRRTARELTDACEIPLSTTYRKLNALDAAGFFEQRIRVGASGKHPGEYKAKSLVFTFRIAESTGLEVSVNTTGKAVDQSRSDGLLYRNSRPRRPVGNTPRGRPGAG